MPIDGPQNPRRSYKQLKTENRFSPGPADQRNQAALRHPERSIYRCFLTDLAGFIDICRAGPDYADRQDRKKTGLFRLSLGTPLFYYFGGQMSIIFIGRIAIVPYFCRGGSGRWAGRGRLRRPLCHRNISPL